MQRFFNFFPVSTTIDEISFHKDIKKRGVEISSFFLLLIYFTGYNISEKIYETDGNMKSGSVQRIWYDSRLLEARGIFILLREISCYPIFRLYEPWNGENLRDFETRSWMDSKHSWFVIGSFRKILSRPRRIRADLMNHHRVIRGG